MRTQQDGFISDRKMIEVDEAKLIGFLDGFVFKYERFCRLCPVAKQCFANASPASCTDEIMKHLTGREG